MTSVCTTRPCARRRPFNPFVPALAALLAVFSLPAAANSFVVDTGTDGFQQSGNTTSCAEVDSSNALTGHCSLRAAIAVGNDIAGSHTITFAPTVLQVSLHNGGPLELQATFTITGNLPVRTIINGTWQISPLQQVDCLGLSDSGNATIGHGNGADGSTIANLSIVGCAHDGISANGHGYTFSNNYIGVDPSGTTAIPNSGHGISLSASFKYDDQLVDTAALQALNNALPTQPVNNAQISNFSVNLITALQNLQPNTIVGNVISGNAGNGIFLFSENLGAVFVTGNFIGTDLTGNKAIGNQASGIDLTGGTFANLISGNTISGNAQYGIDDESGAVYMPNFIMGNRIGLPTAPGTHVGNGLDGIYVSTSPNTDPAYLNPSGTSLIIGPSNVIADNQGPGNILDPDDVNANNGGIVITGSSTGVKVVGNTIGIAEFPLGTPYNSKAYGNADNGIVVTTSGNKIGGSGATDGNIIAANGYHGILLTGNATTGNSILGNSIGVHPGLAGNLGLGNGFDGIHIDSASSTTMGGTGSTDFNTIVANGRNGIKILSGGLQNGWGNFSQQNLVYHNGVATAGIGFDLDRLQNATNPLITAPPEIPANYANLDQAQPVICIGPADTGACAGSTAPASSGGATTLQWTIATHGPANFRMEFFSVNNTDPNQATQMTYLGNQLITTDANGVPNAASCTAGRCSTTLTVATGGSYLMMNTTDITPLTNVPGGGTDWKAMLKCFAGTFGLPTFIVQSCPANDTSEFSNTVNVPLLPPSVTTTAATALSTTGATLNGTVNDNGSTTTVTFEYGTDTSYGTTLAATPPTVAAGSGNTAVSLTLASLTCGTTYHFRADANNGIGSTVNGNDMSFTALACPAGAPTATTTAATVIATTGAKLNGTVNDNGATTTVTFEYGTSTSYGTTTAATPPTVTAGSGSTPVALTLASLTCGTTYHYRVDANNGIGGTIHGNDMSFSTLACPAGAPTVTTTAATAITATGATLNGTVNDNGATTTVTFEYGTSTSYGTTTAATPPTVTAGSGSTPVALTLASLTCGTTYHFRADANNGIGGTIHGNDMSFSTPVCAAQAPTATTIAATTITATGATLNGTVNDKGATTTVTFEYGTSTSYGMTIAATPSTVTAGTGNTAVSLTLASLTCGTTYHYRVDANNGIGGTVNGNDMSFSTAACATQAPTATTNAATAITATGATLNGAVNDHGAMTTVQFEYGTTTSYGTTTAATPPTVAAGSGNTPVSLTLASLTCGTTYHYRVDANNGIGGWVDGNDMSFSTSACAAQAPTATTTSATNVTTSSITFNGNVVANSSVATVFFDYGPNTSYGSSVAGNPATVPAGGVSQPVSATVSAQCGTTVHFRVRATNSVGTTDGNDMTATTGACGAVPPTVSTNAASNITTTSATLNGTGNANNFTTTVNFEYGTTAAYGQTIAATPSPLSGTTATSVTANLSGLICATTYHFRLDGSSAGGSVDTADATFTTSACPAQAPTATTGAATAVTATSATLNGTVSANGTATAVSFDYGTTTAYGSNAVATQSPLAANASNAPVYVVVSGLACGQIYHFRVNADNGASSVSHGADQTFATSACVAQVPTATSLAATAITTTSATLNGTVNANGAATAVSFSYGLNAGYGSTAAATPASLAANAVAAAVSSALSGLTCGTTYHFRVNATNSNGPGYGGDLTFTTAACPVVTTFSGPTATGTGNATAVLSGGGPTCTLVNPAFVTAPVSPPPGESFPDGLFQFNATGCSGSITLTVTFPTAFAAGVQYWKYGPTPSQPSSHWYTLGAANSLSLTGHVATFAIADGGLGDDDLTVNGTIVDAGGPSTPAAVPSQGTMPAPALDSRGLALLILLLAAFGAFVARTRGQSFRP